MITWGFVAGFALADGHLQWVEGKKGTKQGTCGRIILAQMHKEPLEAIQNFLQHEGISPLLYQRKKPSPDKEGIWILTVQIREDVIKFFEATNGLLFQKQEKANFILESLKQLNREREEILNKAVKLRAKGQSWREIARETGVGRVALMSFFRSRNITLLDEKTGADSKSWRRDRIDRGLCAQCGKSRGVDGTKWHCRQCADKRNKLTTKWRRKQIEAGLCRECGHERGSNGTITMCRNCAEAKRDGRRKKPC